MVQFSAVFGLPDLNMVTNRLLRNPADFADVLRPLYGELKAARFKNLLTEHLQIGGDLVSAAPHNSDIWNCAVLP